MDQKIHQLLTILLEKTQAEQLQWTNDPKSTQLCFENGKYITIEKHEDKNNPYFNGNLLIIKIRGHGYNWKKLYSTQEKDYFLVYDIWKHARNKHDIISQIIKELVAIGQPSQREELDGENVIDGRNYS